MGGGLVWVDYQIVFKADEATAKSIFDWFEKSIDITAYDYEVHEEFKLLQGREDGTWVIEYKAESYTEGPADDLNRQFPDLKAVAHVVREQYD